jgi:lipoic acid synthetase
MRKKGRDIPAELAHIAEGIQDSGTTRQEASSLIAASA